MRLELHYPVNPHRVNQSWGIYNPVYEKFGFSRHNGIDIGLKNGQPIYCPIDAKIVKVGNQPSGGGVFVGLLSTQEYQFDDGKSAYVLIDFLHCQSIEVNEGQLVLTGDFIAFGDNTGFSTGSHTHMQCRRVTKDLTSIDSNDANNTFDQSLYWNGYYATDKPILLKILSLLKNFFKGRN